MGESYGRWTLGHDEEVMPNITSANIACGFHGGDPHVMRKTVELAVQHGVAVGAHPGLPDLRASGAGAWRCPPRRSRRSTATRSAPCGPSPRPAGTTLQHVKPHGIQYHMFEENLPLGRAAAEGVVELDPEPDPHDHGHDEVRRGGAQDQGARRRRGLRGPRLRRRRPARLAQARQGRPRLRSGQGGRAGGPHGHGGQGARPSPARRST